MREIVFSSVCEPASPSGGRTPVGLEPTWSGAACWLSAGGLTFYDLVVLLSSAALLGALGLHHLHARSQSG